MLSMISVAVFADLWDLFCYFGFDSLFCFVYGSFLGDRRCQSAVSVRSDLPSKVSIGRSQLLKSLVHILYFLLYYVISIMGGGGFRLSPISAACCLHLHCMLYLFVFYGGYTF